MRSGERCDRCNSGRMKVYHSRTAGLCRVRYLRCTSCRATGQEVVTVDDLGRSVVILSNRTTTSKAAELPPTVPR
jgi:hypothetical protein